MESAKCITHREDKSQNEQVLYTNVVRTCTLYSLNKLQVLDAEKRMSRTYVVGNWEEKFTFIETFINRGLCVMILPPKR